ncbi:MAG: c-type cytochrome [Cyanobacteria bacterium REEB67]|nr:c-type cytochrome [Cyanobacteria bacterium REEB67]
MKLAVRPILFISSALSLAFFCGVPRAYAGSPAATSSSAESLQGKKLFVANSCVNCHSVSGHGGCLAPPLDGIGERRGKAFIMARITDDKWAREAFIKFHPSPELLEHPRLPAEKTRAIVAYLMTIPDAPPGFKIRGHAKAKSASSSDEPLNLKLSLPQQEKPLVLTKAMEHDAVLGKALFYDRGCSACHSIGGLGGHFAPALDGVGARLGRKHVAGHITGAEFTPNNSELEDQDSGKVMPPSNLTDKEIDQISTFLMTVPAAASK